MATNPAKTTKLIGDLTTGGILNLVGAEEIGQEQRDVANEFGGYLAKTYGSWDGFMNHVRKEPALAIADLMGAGWIVGKIGKVATNPAFQQRLITELESLAPTMENVVNKYTKNLTPSGQ